MQCPARVSGLAAEHGQMQAKWCLGFSKEEGDGREEAFRTCSLQQEGGK